MKVTVVDYGLGNLFSVGRAFERVGASIEITDDAKKITNSEKLVLPGVAAFADGMQGLKDRGLLDAVTQFAHSGRPFLGLCLGMQMLFETAEEFGSHRGLGIIPGRVLAIPNVGIDGAPHKIPHIGWSEFMPAHNGDESWQGTVMQGINPGDCGYFVHSFRCVPTDDSVRVANTFYNGQSIAAVIQQGAVVGCQFHPEKSGTVGLRILKSFVQN